jgi:cytochrome c oxidase assembly protein subunit 11
MAERMKQKAVAPVRKRDIVVASACGALVAVMVGMAYAAVPLYDWFCRTTGFNGTTQVASFAPSQVLDRRITVRFDANVAAGLPWQFAPERTSIEARLGEVVTMDYIVVNQSAKEVTGVAGYNVAPLNMGAYFRKINCFCFTDQTLKPRERQALTVVFYVDPELAKDPDGADVNTITLSYTFHLPREPRVGSGGEPSKTTQRVF